MYIKHVRNYVHYLEVLKFKVIFYEPRFLAEFV